jgi:hypothetical protein
MTRKIASVWATGVAIRIRSASRRQLASASDSALLALSMMPSAIARSSGAAVRPDQANTENNDFLEHGNDSNSGVYANEGESGVNADSPSRFSDCKITGVSLKTPIFPHRYMRTIKIR